MNISKIAENQHDQYEISRFLAAQEKEDSYKKALAEIKKGEKMTHWIWWVFPIPYSISFCCSDTDRKYAIYSLEEAKAYLENPVLKKRLLEISEALLQLPTDDPVAVFGIPDAYKLRACMTLFRYIAHPKYSVFEKVLRKYCLGIPCPETEAFIKSREL